MQTDIVIYTAGVDHYNTAINGQSISEKILNKHQDMQHQSFSTKRLMGKI